MTLYGFFVPTQAAQENDHGRGSTAANPSAAVVGKRSGTSASHAAPVKKKLVKRTGPSGRAAMKEVVEPATTSSAENRAVHAADAVVGSTPQLAGFLEEGESAQEFTAATADLLDITPKLEVLRPKKVTLTADGARTPKSSDNSATAPALSSSAVPVGTFTQPSSGEDAELVQRSLDAHAARAAAAQNALPQPSPVALPAATPSSSQSRAAHLREVSELTHSSTTATANAPLAAPPYPPLPVAHSVVRLSLGLLAHPHPARLKL